MGIPRLSQDLHPYADHVILGQTQSSSTAPPSEESGKHVHSLIIDGPSLVYYIYNKLLGYKAFRSCTTAAISIPSYLEINQAAHHFLDDLTNHGVDVPNTFFDGGLPETKRSVRLDRMERLRQQLETYRKVHPDSFPVGTSQQVPIDFDEALWRTTAPITSSSRKPTLPAPPFMVASVIESLQTSRDWKSKVHIVPGEADLFCATAARQTPGSAILTNDSDLAVHDLGCDGRIVLLQSLEKKTKHKPKPEPKPLAMRKTTTEKEASSSPDPAASQITALALTPTHMAERLNVSSLLRFGFERSIDQSLSLSLVRERARDDSRLDKYRAEYAAFTQEYLPLPSTRTSTTNSTPFPVPTTLDSIDPRTCELVVDVTDKDTPHLYLTPLVEDPARDSSWSYGADIRQLAYSVLLLLGNRNSNSSHSHKTVTVTEYARKGQRIAAARIEPLSIPQTQSRLIDTLGLLEDYLSQTSTQEGSQRVNCSIFNWYILAFSLVRRQKIEAGKSVPSHTQILQLLEIDDSKSRPSASASTRTAQWDDIHLLANLHAVLYSFRMLKQILGYVLLNGRLPRPDQNNIEYNINNLHDHDGIDPSAIVDTSILILTKQLSQKLELMPDIQHLFLDISHLRLMGRDLCKDETQLSTVIRRVRYMLDLGDDASQSLQSTPDYPHNATGFTTATAGRDTAEGSTSHIQHDEESSPIIDRDFVAPKPKKKTRKTDHKAESASGSGQVATTKSSNPFDLLTED
ncbi:hypothetical protein ABEF95_005004 [Exophiala dermatitidis]